MQIQTKVHLLGPLVPTISKFINVMSVFLFLLQIGHRHVVDASLQEEACSLAQLLVSVNGNNSICAMQKVGPGALDPDSIFEMIEVEMFTPPCLMT